MALLGSRGRGAWGAEGARPRLFDVIEGAETYLPPRVRSGAPAEARSRASLRGLGRILRVIGVPAVFPRLWAAAAGILATAAATGRLLPWALRAAAPHSRAQRWVSGDPRRVCEEARGPERPHGRTAAAAAFGPSARSFTCGR